MEPVALNLKVRRSSKAKMRRRQPVPAVNRESTLIRTSQLNKFQHTGQTPILQAFQGRTNHPQRNTRELTSNWKTSTKETPRKKEPCSKSIARDVVATCVLTTKQDAGRRAQSQAILKLILVSTNAPTAALPRKVATSPRLTFPEPPARPLGCPGSSRPHTQQQEYDF